MSEHGARALHVRLEELRGCDQAGLLCWRQTRSLRFGAGGGAAADAGQILRQQKRYATTLSQLKYPGFILYRRKLKLIINFYTLLLQEKRVTNNSAPKFNCKLFILASVSGGSVAFYCLKE